MELHSATNLWIFKDGFHTCDEAIEKLCSFSIVEERPAYRGDLYETRQRLEHMNNVITIIFDVHVSWKYPKREQVLDVKLFFNLAMLVTQRRITILFKTLIKTRVYINA